MSDKMPSRLKEALTFCIIYTDYISIFIQQSNISFHNDFSPKTVILRVLSWDREKTDKKHDRET